MSEKEAVMFPFLRKMPEMVFLMIVQWEKEGGNQKRFFFSTSSIDLLTDLGQIVKGSCVYKLY